MNQEGNRTPLSITNCEKDLGVYIDDKLNFEEHINKQVSKARGIAGVINRNITNKTKNVMEPLFKSMARPVTAGI